MRRLPFPLLDRKVYPERILPVLTAEREKLIPSASPEVLEAVEAAGYPVIDVTWPFTSDSRHPITVKAIASTPAVAAWEPQVQVQALGMADGRRVMGIGLQGWRPSPQRRVRVNGDGIFILGVVPDGLYDEILPDGMIRTWVIEYSHGAFTRKRLREVIHAHRGRPQIWLTPSHAHAAKIRELLEEVLPGWPWVRVITVDWTGGHYANC